MVVLHGEGKNSNFSPIIGLLLAVYKNAIAAPVGCCRQHRPSSVIIEQKDHTNPDPCAGLTLSTELYNGVGTERRATTQGQTAYQLDINRLQPSSNYKLSNAAKHELTGTTYVFALIYQIYLGTTGEGEKGCAVNWCCVTVIKVASFLFKAAGETVL